MRCNYCNSIILVGWVAQGNLRFCDEKCHRNGYLLLVSKRVSSDSIERKIKQIHQGCCPKCSGPGPVEVHKSSLVYSFLIRTEWTTYTQISCRACGVKSQLRDICLSLLFGWWGVPWGIVYTPIQVMKNFVGICFAPNAMLPSQELEKFVRTDIANQLLAQDKTNKST